MPRSLHVNLASAVRAFASDGLGATAIEYGLLVAFVFLTILAAVTLFASRTTAMWVTISNHMG